MPFKDQDYVPVLWDYDKTHEAVVLSQQELKELRDQLNEEYLRRWSGYIRGVHRNEPYMDYTSGSDQFTDSDGKHIQRLPSWDGSLPTPTKSTSHQSQYRMADGNVSGSYWSRYAYRDFRGCPAYYGPLDRYIDGTVSYSPSSNSAPRVSSDYQGPDGGQTFPLGTSEWRNAEQYQPHGVSDVTKDRSFKHLIDGLANIVDIDKYYGTGIQHGDPVNPYNEVNYGDGQSPNYSERISHSYRQLGFVGNSTPGHPTNHSGSVADWIPILQSEQRNEYYIRACNYQHWIWYFEDETYFSKYSYSCSGSLTAEMPVAKSFNPPKVISGSATLTYSQTGERSTKVRQNYNPGYYGHRESYTSCQVACTGFCSQSCFHVCDEQCVYLCDDKCGYSCMDGTYAACGSVCIANCQDLCGGDSQQEGGRGGSPCQVSCMDSTGATAGCGGCTSNCTGFVKDEQACSDCVGYCSNGCDTICKGTCKFNCTDPCKISCSSQCVQGGLEDKQGCASSICKGGCDGSCEGTCKGTCDGCEGSCEGTCDGGCDGSSTGKTTRSTIGFNVDYTPEWSVTIGEQTTN